MRLEVLLRPSRRTEQPEHVPGAHVEEEQQRCLGYDGAHDGGLRRGQAEETTLQALGFGARIA